MGVFKNIPLAFKFLLDKNVPLKKKIWIILAILYFVSPLDIIADPVLGFGIIDDFVLIAYVLSKLSEDLKLYHNRENKENETQNEENIKKDKIIEDVEYKIVDDDE
ncbi:YkvA family protein [Thermohalobacter berrensis]|uniref:DUF1232 domain-containing protein n=1 Tax=Thermohalobacter berrensis TaxID=99594 RepID=A0A419T504_9FIRM|nr:DUF1232 domain-containing protein [Thermohalobacter berrensis]RKD32468.1 hypothetical protein BET03_11180 [Thermohalobacter berrensis]